MILHWCQCMWQTHFAHLREMSFSRVASFCQSTAVYISCIHMPLSIHFPQRTIIYMAQSLHTQVYPYQFYKLVRSHVRSLFTRIPIYVSYCRMWQRANCTRCISTTQPASPCATTWPMSWASWVSACGRPTISTTRTTPLLSKRLKTCGTPSGPFFNPMECPTCRVPLTWLHHLMKMTIEWYGTALRFKVPSLTLWLTD